MTKAELAELNQYLVDTFIISHNGLPEEAWFAEGEGFHHLEFMMHDFGCWAILSHRNGSEETARINIGTYETPEAIQVLIKALKVGVERLAE